MKPGLVLLFCLFCSQLLWPTHDSVVITEVKQLLFQHFYFQVEWLVKQNINLAVSDNSYFCIGQHYKII